MNCIAVIVRYHTCQLHSDFKARGEVVVVNAFMSWCMRSTVSTSCAVTWALLCLFRLSCFEVSNKKTYFLLNHFGREEIKCVYRCLMEILKEIGPLPNDLCSLSKVYKNLNLNFKATIYAFKHIPDAWS